MKKRTLRKSITTFCLLSLSAMTGVAQEEIKVITDPSYYGFEATNSVNMLKTWTDYSSTIVTEADGNRCVRLSYASAPTTSNHTALESLASDAGATFLVHTACSYIVSFKMKLDPATPKIASPIKVVLVDNSSSDFLSQKSVFYSCNIEGVTANGWTTIEQSVPSALGIRAVIPNATVRIQVAAEASLNPVAGTFYIDDIVVKVKIPAGVSQTELDQTRVYGVKGKIVVESAVAQTVDLYAITGVLLQSVQLNAGEAITLDNLEAGIYIVNNQKVIVQ